MVASSSGAIVRQLGAVVGAVEQRRQRLAERPLDRERDDGGPCAGVRDPLGARRIGEDQRRLGQLERMLHLMRFPPAVEQGGDRRPP